MMSSPTLPPPPAPVAPRPRAVAFVDGQNLFHDAERIFGYNYPNYDIAKLCQAVCDNEGWEVAGIRFYTGVPSAEQNPTYNAFWGNKLFAMQNPKGKIEVVRRALKNRDVSIQLYHGVSLLIPPTLSSDPVPCPLDSPWVTHSGKGLVAGSLVAQQVFTEKGIDVSIAVDAIRYALEDRFDVCLFFSRDADLEPAVREIEAIAASKKTKYTIASAFPFAGKGYGIPRTREIKIAKATYDACLDPRNYFPKHPLRRR